MKMLDQIRRTSDDKSAARIRLGLAVLFLMTGAMKLLVPMLGEAFAGQLQAAQIPMYEVSLWLVPLVEIALGGILAVGLFARPSALVAIVLMVVATYVHIVVEDPTLFPLQPSAPIIPIAVILLSVFLLWRGGGSWSRDLKAATTPT
jgi:uncharacterized membrane protein YphA (DoxX/SURF4 family)